jgi:hypothetical protein
MFHGSVDGELAVGRQVDYPGQRCVAPVLHLLWFLAPVLVCVVCHSLEGDQGGAGSLTKRSECIMDFSC